MSQAEELQGGMCAKHQTRHYCFTAHAALWVSTVLLKIQIKYLSYIAEVSS